VVVQEVSQAGKAATAYTDSSALLSQGTQAPNAARFAPFTDHAAVDVVPAARAGYVYEGTNVPLATKVGGYSYEGAPAAIQEVTQAGKAVTAFTDSSALVNQATQASTFAANEGAQVSNLEACV